MAENEEGKKIIGKVVFLIASMPKTIFFNIKTFGFTGMKLPVFVSYRTRIRCKYKGAIRIEAPIKRFMMKYGYGGTAGVISNASSEICLESGSELVLRGSAFFAEGCSIRNSGTIVLGKHCSFNKNSFLSCFKSISIGNGFVAGWNVNIRDSDGHALIKNGTKMPLDKPVVIGDRVWCASYVDILKGVRIGNNSVVAYRSLITKSFEADNLLIGGSPARIIQEHIDWEY